MLTKKICLLGASGVGKTSLVGRFVRQIFSEKYLTTIGVKVDKKEVDVDGTPVKLMIWDLAGEDEMEGINYNYVRGAAGCFLVADGTDSATFDTAMKVHDRVREQSGELPCIMLCNKHDLQNEWAIKEDDLAELTSRGLPHFNTSAKSGANVETAFVELARLTMQG